MADIASILVDGQDPSMPALRQWLQALYALAVAGGTGVGNYATSAMLPASPGDEDAKIAIVTDDGSNTGWWLYSGGAWAYATALNAAFKGNPGLLAAATNPQLDAGTDDTVTVTPKGLSHLGLTSALAPQVSSIASAVAIVDTFAYGSSSVAPTGTASTANQTRSLTAPIGHNGSLGAISVACEPAAGSGTAGKIKISKPNATTPSKYDWVADIPYSFKSGENNLTTADFGNVAIAADMVLGVYSASAIFSLAAGAANSAFGFSGDMTGTNNGVALTGTVPVIRATINADLGPINEHVTDLEAAVGPLQAQGEQLDDAVNTYGDIVSGDNAVATGFNTSFSNTRWNATPFGADGPFKYLTTYCNSGSGGAALLSVAKKNASDPTKLDVVKEWSVNFTAGQANTFDIASLNGSEFDVQADWVWGFYTAVATIAVELGSAYIIAGHYNGTGTTFTTSGTQFVGNATVHGLDESKALKTQIATLNSKVSVLSQPSHSDGKSLWKWRALAAKLMRAGVGKIKIATTGDSWMYKNRIPQQLANILRSLGIAKAGEGWISSNYAEDPEGSPLDGVTYTVTNGTYFDAGPSSGTVSPPAFGCAPDGKAVYTTGSTMTIDIAGMTCDTITIFYSDTTGSWRYSTNGGSSYTTVTGGGTNALKTVVISGLSTASTSHLMIDTAPNTGGATVAFIGFWPTIANGVGFEIFKLGNSNMSFGDQFPTYGGTCVTPIATLLGVDIVIHAACTNDYRRAGSSPAAYVAGLDILIDAYKAANQDTGFVIIVPAQSGVSPADPTNGTMQKYRDAIIPYCNTKGVEYYDMLDEWGSYARESAAGMWNDTLHPNDDGAYCLDIRLVDLFLTGLVA